MTSLLNGLRWFLLLILAPTRFVIDCWRRRESSPDGRGRLLWRWNAAWFGFEASICVVLIGASAYVDKLPAQIGWLSVVAFYLAFSRAAEISYAYVRDVADRLTSAAPGTNLSGQQRIVMAAKSYAGLIVDFAVMFFFIPEVFQLAGWLPPNCSDISLKAKNFFDVLYFSVMTVTTTGYGDLSRPLGKQKHWQCGKFFQGCS